MEFGVVLVKQAFSECPNYSKLVQALLSEPVYNLYRTCRLTPGIPVAPMLAKPTKSFAEVLKRMSGILFTCEYKRSEEHTSELPSLMRISYAVFCLKKKK